MEVQKVFYKLKNFALIMVFPIIGLSACGAPPPKAMAPAAAMIAAPVTAPAAIDLTDGIYTGMVAGSMATLTIRGGQPYAYFWAGAGGYNGQVLSFDDGVIKIDRASIPIRNATENRIDGRFLLNGNSSPFTVIKTE
jgi:hypothetical protein